MANGLKRATKGWATLGALCAMLVTAPAFGQAALERIKQRGVVTVGYRDDAPPFSSKDKAGKPVGYSLDLCQPIAASLIQQAGIAPTAVKYLAVAVDQLERYVKGGNVDLMCAATSDTPERRKSMDFSSPIYVSSVMLLVRKDAKVQSAAQLAGAKPVSVIDRTTAAQAVEAYAKQKNLALTVAKSVAPDAALGQLKLGWASAYARDDVLMAMQLMALPDARDYMVLPEALSSENIAIAFASGDAALHKTVEQALAEAHKSGAWASAYERWFMKPIAPANQPLNLPMSEALKSSLAKLR